MNKELFGKRLNRARKEKRMSADALAEKCGVNGVYIRLIECASRIPSMKVFVSLCNALELSPDYFLTDSLDGTIREQIYNAGQFTDLLSKLSLLTQKDMDIITSTLDILVNNMNVDA